MRWTIGMATLALVLAFAACQKDAKPPAKAPPKAEPAPAPAAQEAEPPPNEGAPRRERAGIEGGEAPEPERERPSVAARPAAELVDDPVLAPPPLKGGAEVDTGREVLKTVAAYLKEKTPEGTMRRVMAPSVRLTPPPSPMATVRLWEQVEAEGGCQEGTRTLSIGEAEGGGWQVHHDEPTLAPCRDARRGVVAGTHEMLRLAWDTRDDKKAREALGDVVWVRDGGSKVAEHPEDAVVGGDARWILALAAKTEAQRGNTKALGGAGTVRGEDVTFVYEEQAGLWVLVGVSRGVLPRGLSLIGPAKAGARTPR